MIIHFHLKPVLHDKKKEDRMTSPRLFVFPLTRTIYSRMGTTEGFSNTGCGWSSPDLGTSTDAGVVKWLAHPQLGVPFVGAPTLIPPDWDSQGSVGLNSWEFGREKEGKGFSLRPYFPSVISWDRASHLCFSSFI